MSRWYRCYLSILQFLPPPPKINTRCFKTTLHVIQDFKRPRVYTLYQQGVFALRVKVHRFVFCWILRVATREGHVEFLDDLP